MALIYGGYVTEDDGRHRRWGARYVITEAAESFINADEVRKFCQELKTSSFIDAEILSMFIEPGAMSPVYSALLTHEKVKIIPR